MAEYVRVTRPSNVALHCILFEQTCVEKSLLIRQLNDSENITLTDLVLGLLLFWCPRSAAFC